MINSTIRSAQLVFLSMHCFFGAVGQRNAYRDEIRKWDANRIRELKAEDGWLNLTGLYWLEKGINTFGSGRENKIIFPAGTIAEKAGYFEVSGNKVILVTDRNDIFRGKVGPVKKELIFDGDVPHFPEKIISSGHLRWTIIRRGTKLGVRLRNLRSPAVTRFAGIRRFPPDTAWIIPAVLEKTNSSSRIAITNVLGQTSIERSPGRLSFFKNGVKYSLSALEEDNHLFVIFSDASNGTYPSGRFLSVAKPDPRGLTTIDFNKAYNPPCAFTPYATCPLPPKENVLNLAVTAGEKYVSH